MSDFTIRFSIGTKAFAQAVLVGMNGKEKDLLMLGRGKWMTVTDFYTHPFIRGKGYGRIMMRSVCDYADKNKINLWLVVTPHGRGRLKTEVLINFYSSCGFKLRSDQSNEMTRKAKHG